MQLFIIITILGIVWICLCVPETKGVPLEEMAAVFGIQDEVAIFSENIQITSPTDEAAHGSVTGEYVGDFNEVTAQEKKGL